MVRHLTAIAKLDGEQSAKMYPAFLWSKLLATMRIRACPSLKVVRSWMDRFFLRQASGTPLYCSVIFSLLSRLGRVIVVGRWESGKRRAFSKLAEQASFPRPRVVSRQAVLAFGRMAFPWPTQPKRPEPVCWPAPLPARCGELSFRVVLAKHLRNALVGSRASSLIGHHG